MAFPRKQSERRCEAIRLRSAGAALSPLIFAVALGGRDGPHVLFRVAFIKAVSDFLVHCAVYDSSRFSTKEIHQDGWLNREVFRKALTMTGKQCPTSDAGCGLG